LVFLLLHNEPFFFSGTAGGRTLFLAI